MEQYPFLFDLDATITKAEILPELARYINREAKMRSITERTMQGEIPFERSFLERVEILREIPVSDVRKMVAQVPLHEELVEFIRENRERCYVVTGNLDIWIEELMEKIGVSGHVYCSHATVENDYIQSVDEVIDKALAIAHFSTPFVAVGDGNNDADMIGAASIGIGFGAVRPIAPALVRNATHAIYTEEKLCQFLRRLL